MFSWCATQHYARTYSGDGSASSQRQAIVLANHDRLDSRIHLSVPQKYDLHMTLYVCRSDDSLWVLLSIEDTVLAYVYNYVINHNKPLYKFLKFDLSNL